jgi:hypothetical protein
MERFAVSRIISIAWTPAQAGATTCFDERPLESQDDEDHPRASSRRRPGSRLSAICMGQRSQEIVRGMETSAH